MGKKIHFPGLSFPGKTHPPEYELLCGITVNVSHLADYSRGVSKKTGLYRYVLRTFSCFLMIELKW